MGDDKNVFCTWEQKLLTWVKKLVPPGNNTSFVETKLQTLLCNTKLPTLVQNFLPWCKTLYLGAKFHTLVQNFIPWCKTSYLGTKLYTYVQILILRSKTACMCTKRFPWVQNSVLGYKLHTLMPDVILPTKHHVWVQNIARG
jgi:hypothetical protein